MRTQIPKFRLPETVLDEEVGYIIDLEPELRLGQAHRQHEGGAGRRLRRDLRRLRRAARARSRDSGPRRSGRQHPYRHRLAVVGFVRAYRQDRQARDRARRRQHGDGLLPHLAPAWAARTCSVVVRSGFEEMKASPWEKEDAHARGHPDPQFPRAQGIHAQQAAS